MRYYPENEDGWNDIKQLEASDWMVEMLKKNPSYCSWGNFEDYMAGNGDGWGSSVEINEVSELWGLDEYNELVNFYFFIDRDAKECQCKGTGLNPETKQLSDDWYDFARTGRKWMNNITDIEVKALVKAGSLSDLTDKRYSFDEEKNVWTYLDTEKHKWVEMEGEPVFPTAEKVNQWSRKGIGHDSYNEYICVKARAKHLGVYGKCEHCEGKGYVYIEEKPRLALQMWMLHPRKGAARGVILRNINQDEIPKVINYLKEARDRNAERFSKL